jgi:fructan beta-fructosidase
MTNIAVINYDLTNKTGKLSGAGRLSISSDKLEPFTITLSNDAGEKVVIGYDKTKNQYFIDRTNSGIVSFEKGFAVTHTAPKLSVKENFDLTLIIDDASVELFADDGLSVMTEIFFPNELFSNINIQSANGFTIRSLKYNAMKSIWR